MGNVPQITNTTQNKPVWGKWYTQHTQAGGMAGHCVGGCNVWGMGWVSQLGRNQPGTGCSQTDKAQRQGKPVGVG